jgi:hypothetical protein
MLIGARRFILFHVYSSNRGTKARPKSLTSNKRTPLSQSAMPESSVHDVSYSPGDRRVPTGVVLSDLQVIERIGNVLYPHGRRVGVLCAEHALEESADSRGLLAPNEIEAADSAATQRPRGAVTLDLAIYPTAGSIPRDEAALRAHGPFPRPAYHTIPDRQRIR